jgi:hypothetical protein
MTSPIDVMILCRNAARIKEMNANSQLLGFRHKCVIAQLFILPTVRSCTILYRESFLRKSMLSLDRTPCTVGIIFYLHGPELNSLDVFPNTPILHSFHVRFAKNVGYRRKLGEIFL